MKPFDESKEPVKFWKSELFDQYLPPFKGFVSDFVYFTRGLEAPVILSFWAALFTISSMVKREAWMDWGSLGRLYGNMYLFFITPPGVGKSTMLDIVDKILVNSQDYIEDENIQHVKELKILRNKTTAEALLEYLGSNKQGGNYYYFKTPDGKTLYFNGKPVKYRKGSDVVLLINELSTLFGKSGYNDSLVENLLDLYDAKDIFEWRTIKRGVVKLRNLYTNLLGASTPKNIIEYLPRVVIGDGFLSRTIVVYATVSPNAFPIPMRTKKGPTAVDMCERLAWIAENVQGTYTLTDEARERYNDWYINTFKPTLANDELFRNIRSREGINVLKVAMLLRMSRYEKGNQIEKIDIDTAIRVLHVTYNTSVALIEQASGDDFMRKVSKVEEYLEEHTPIQRQDLIRRLHLPAAVVTQILTQLLEEGKIEIYYNGRLSSFVTGTSREVYKYVKKGKTKYSKYKKSDEGKDIEGVPDVRFHKKSS